MKKQYMQPKFQMTMFAEDAITTSITFSFGAFIDNENVDSWF